MPHRCLPRLAALTLSLALLAGAGACGSSTTTDAGPTTTGAPTTASTTGTTAASTTPGSTTPSSTRTTPASSTTAPGAKPPASGATPSTTAPMATTTTAPGTDPGMLPQTDEKPSASGALWDEWTTGLWNAIVHDDPAAARPFFFPLGAYRQVKAISDIDGDYQRRLIAYYEEDIHTLHRQLGTQADAATFVKIDVPATAQWIKPGVEYNKGAYWRVFDSKLVYEVGGKQKTILVKSMISWRGQWYVVHLSSVR